MASNNHQGDGPRFVGWNAQLVIVLLVFVALVEFAVFRHSPTFDEPAHLAAGWSHWELGRFDLYRVNPPLVRLIAALPLWISGVDVDLRTYDSRPGARSEFSVARKFIETDPKAFFRNLALSRSVCLPLALLGAYVGYRWAGELYGARSGLLVATLWCFSPTIVANSQLITPDIGAASFCVAATYVYWKWLLQPSWHRAFTAGGVLGLALLTKSTLVVLLPLWPLLWLIYRGQSVAQSWREGGRMLCMLLVSVFIVNLGYGFEGSFMLLKDYEFVSGTLRGNNQATDEMMTSGNVFSDVWLGTLAIPMPRNFVLGIDTQRQEFERRKSSYLRGEWRWGGWWYYYLYALVVKEPLGICGLAGLALMSRPRAKLRDELVVICPMLFIFGLVSSQTGFNHHYRYVLPALPFFFILVSRVVAKPTIATTGACLPILRSWLVGTLVVWFVMSSLFVYPHSLSYFNEIAGGPLGGPKHLLGSSTDWGQDLYYLRDWVDEHLDVDDFDLAWTATLIDPALVEIHAAPPPSLAQWQANREYEQSSPGTERRWYLLSVNELYENSDRYAYFREIQPTTTIAYTIYTYHLSSDDIYQRIDISMEQ